jgi:putative flavoprotein involved in K+ transport
MADYLEAYADRFDLDVRSSTTATYASRRDGRFVLMTDAGELAADSIIVATGGRPRTPDFAIDLDPRVRQLHSVEYRRPGQLADGAILIVGAGNSGAEIALDIAASGRRDVVLSGRDVGEVPALFPDRAPLPLWRPAWWVIDHLLTNNTLAGRGFRTRVRGALPRVRASRKALTAAGITWVPRVAGVEGGQPVLDDGTVLAVANVVWCTGFDRDHSWIDVPAFTENGRPRHTNGIATDVAGLYFLGLPYQRGVTSGLVAGADKDARLVVDDIVSRKRARGTFGRRPSCHGASGRTPS